MRRALSHALRHLVGRRPRGWYPLLAVQYLTYRCRFRCPYCSDGAARPYYQLPERALDAESMLAGLGHLRAACDHLVLTGGEPTEYPALEAVLRGLGALGFDGVVLTTNGHAVGPFLGAIATSIDHLVFSVQTLDHALADRLSGLPGSSQQVLANLERAARWPDRRYEIIVSSVATPDHLEDLYSVYERCRRWGARFALCPQLVGVKAHPALARSQAYRQLFEHLIAERRRGGPVYGSVPYLEAMRDLSPFECRPSTMVAVDPAGEVFYPCLERGTVAGNLLQTPDLHALRREGRRRHGPDPSCDNRCHSACALGFGVALASPIRVALEEGRARWRAGSGGA